MQLGDVVPPIDLRTSDGEAVSLADVVAQPTVVALPRYYG